MLWLPFLFFEKTYVSWLLPYLFGIVFLNYPKACLLGLSP